MWQSWQSSSRDSNELTRIQWINQWNSRLDCPMRQKSPLLAFLWFTTPLGGCSATEWEFETFLSSIRWLFKDYPSVDEFTRFPLDFCRHRWLENVPVVERALVIIPFVMQYVTAAKSGKVAEPKNKSFENVQESVKDTLLTAKLNFFLMIAKEIQPFLTKYQADKPLLPFLPLTWRI